MRDLIISLSLFSRLFLPVSTTGSFLVVPVAINEIVNQLPKEEVLAERTMDLTKRNPGKEVNEIFRDNILLILHYLKGDINQGRVFLEDPSLSSFWEKMRKPFEVGFTLNPNETFAFHDKYLPEFEGKVAKTIPVKYAGSEGFKVVDGLYGNGVCHLATLMNWVASEAGLKTVALVNHDFFPVPETPREYGVSIYYTGDGEARRQNLYITNTFDFPVVFRFLADRDKVELRIVK